MAPSLEKSTISEKAEIAHPIFLKPVYVTRIVVTKEKDEAHSRLKSIVFGFTDVPEYNLCRPIDRRTITPLSTTLIAIASMFGAIITISSLIEKLKTPKTPPINSTKKIFGLIIR